MLTVPSVVDGYSVEIVKCHSQIWFRDQMEKVRVGKVGQ